jgi:hypothetical protein
VLTCVTLEAVAACAFAVLIAASLTHSTAIASIGSGTIHKTHKLAFLIRGWAFFEAAMSAIPLVIIGIAGADPCGTVARALPTALKSQTVF